MTDLLSRLKRQGEVTAVEEIVEGNPVRIIPLWDIARLSGDSRILLKRALGLSHYGFKEGGEMTSREREDFCFRATARWFGDKREFQVYVMTHEYPLGRCVIGYGRDAKKYDDSQLFS